jgi:hypothetical protein
MKNEQGEMEWCLVTIDLIQGIAPGIPRFGVISIITTATIQHEVGASYSLGYLFSLSRV